MGTREPAASNHFSFGRLLRAWTPVVLVMSSIVLFSSIEGGGRVWPVIFAHQDKALHFVVYAIFGSLLMRALWLSDERLARPATLVVMLCFVSGFGSFDEFYQGGVPYRMPDVWDWFVDCVGGGVGGSLMLSLLWFRRVARDRQGGPDRELEPSMMSDSSGPAPL